MGSSNSIFSRINQWWLNRIIRTKILIGIFLGVLVYQAISTAFQMQTVEKEILDTYKQNAINLSVSVDCIQLKDTILFFNLLDRIGRTEVVGIKIDDNHPSCVERESFLSRVKSSFLAELNQQQQKETQTNSAELVLDENIEVIDEDSSAADLPVAALVNNAAIDLTFDVDKVNGRLESTQININGDIKPQLLYNVKVNGVEFTFDLTDLPQKKLDQFLFLAATALGNLVVLLFIIWILSGRIVDPLKRLTQFARDIIESDTIEKGGDVVTVEIQANDETGVLSRAINNMITKLQISYKQLVKSKAAIGDLLDNTGQGFFSFGPDYRIDAAYSKACDDFFEQTIAGMDALDLMVPGNKSEVQQLTDLLFTGTGDLNLLGDLLPGEIELNDRILSVDYRFIQKNNDDVDDRMMVILTDITQKRALEKQLEKDEELNELIVRIARDRDGFVQFVQDTHAMLEKIDGTLESNAEKIDLVELHRDLHTLKGVSASFGLFEFSKRSHSLEDELHGIEPEQLFNDQEKLNTFKQTLGDLKFKLRTSLESVDDIISWEEVIKGNERPYKVPENKIKQLEDLFGSAKSLPVKTIRQAINNLRKQPIQPVFKKYVRSAEKLAQNLGKTIVVRDRGGDVEVNYKRLDPLFDVLVHIMRNSIDHGMESIEERVKQGKPEVGTIVLSAKSENGTLVLTISDDGGGINTQKVKQAAIGKGLITESEAASLSEGDIVKLIFKPGFSTSEQVSDISGRGIGMDAVKSRIKDLGGSIAIKTAPGKGTAFVIKIPEA